ncbi:outer membrane protein assembly factor BamA [Sphingomonas psychrotolerans]|uniref:Outer membrane protein assembly factor BamA n=1 Tax=Sphingomonas psychrotolerans TaxID=1327635 RepID=A0A2K8MKN5_9SPHN|nr:outer membrane protein assembly factor BamA [Sphingomonas psychrotolerans]ATY34433.1 outer membrane protein assembly factor BamA [Sphingomonas psychrotolerans]
MLSGLAHAQTAPAPTAPVPIPQAVTVPAVPVQQVRTIRSLRVEGSQRVEPETVLSYTRLRTGDTYTNETVDQAIKDLLASELLAEVEIAGVETGDLVIRIRENPVINRVIYEGNKRLKQDKIGKEVKLAPRQIFTRTAVRADVARIIELYRRQGRFAAHVEPKMVSLDQNRVDVIFEINEGPKSKVRQINIIGNEVFSDGKLRGEMATKTSSLMNILSSNTSYDQDRLAYDQQKLRQFYLTEGYADFRVISAVAELTPDKRDFIITYVVEEGPRYKFGPVTVDSAIRDFDDKRLATALAIKEGQWYNAKAVEDTVEQLSETAGAFGYAFADVRPEFQRDREALTMTMNFHIGESNRTYIERIEITGNRQTQDKVIRREFRVAEGDAFNTFLVKRSQDRINSLGYFQDKFEVERKEGSAPDRIVLAANVEERPNGELTLSAGFSSLERFILQASIRQRNFRGMGQTVSASVDYSSYSKSVELGFTEPYLFDTNIALGGTLFRQDYNAFNYIGSDRSTTYSQVATGGQLVAGLPLTEYWTLSGRYTLRQDNVTLDESSFYTNGQCDPLKAGRYYCEAVGNRITSLVGVSLIYDSLNSRLRPTRGQRMSIGADFAGLGGEVKYARARFEGSKYWNVGSGFIFSVSGEGGYIHSLEKKKAGIDPVRITDRFYLGEPQFRGFDIRGVGPRVQRIQLTGDPLAPGGSTQAMVTGDDNVVDDALGGKAYYLTKAELEIPLGAGAAEMGLRPSIFVMAGSLFGITRPGKTIDFEQAKDASGNLLFNKDGSPTLLPKQQLDASNNPLFIATGGANAGAATPCSVGYGTTPANCVGTSINTPYTTPAFYERFVGDSAKPRLSVGFGVNWNSPFGPLRIDIAKTLVTVDGDDDKLVTFNVGTQF